MIVIILCSIGIEIVLILLYRRFYLKLNKLIGTGKLPYITNANNWKQFILTLLIIFPILELIYSMYYLFF
jgi:hypothetical protein